MEVSPKIMTTSNTKKPNKATTNNGAKSSTTKNSAAKAGTANRKPRKGKKKRSKAKRRVTLIFLSSLLVLSLTLLVLALAFYIKYGTQLTNYQRDAQNKVSASTKDTFRQSETSLVYDTNSELLSVLKGEKDVYYVESADIPQLIKDAMISIEDKKFMTHVGVDLKANVRAVLALVKNKGDIKQGASTITQQLARNIFLTHEVSFERKFKEIFLAMELERKYNKNLILEFYLNNIYFANGYYGVQAASKGYFGKDVSELSLGEIGFLCAIPNNPTIYNPINHKENTLKRSERILKQMLNDGKITEKEYKKAVKEKIKLKKQTLEKQNYVETFVFYTATRALMKQEGFVFQNQFSSAEEEEEYQTRYQEAYNRLQRSLYYEGYRIYTSIDLEKQDKLQEAVDNALKGFTDVTEDGIYKMQSGAVTIDNDTGRVVAIVGGRYQDTAGYTLNRGYQSFRQPGSAIKPLIVYAPAFEKGYYPDDIVIDEKFKGGPSNSNNSYSGAITVKRAIEQSKNTIAWKLFEEMTPKVGLSYLLQMDFAKINKNDYYPAISLGGFTVGVSPLEITSAYAALANDGIYREPTCIVEIRDSDGNVIVGNKQKEKRIYDTNAARMMTYSMQGVMQNGTGRNLNLKTMSNAGKTGTTNDKKDGWFVGYTAYYTTGVWVGYDTPKKQDDLSGASYPGSIWNKFMTDIHEGLPDRKFPAFKDRVVETVTPTPTPEETQFPPEEEITPTPEETQFPPDPTGEGENPEDEDDFEDDFEEDETENEFPVATPTPDIDEDSDFDDAEGSDWEDNPDDTDWGN